ncbi:hypothetical protein [Pseudoalteromonas sp. T1lg48]|uniref:hypothetical protein n=1 Tax=Pseudoalteromonas sp. T1lg48 TaxID=2077100 RepID=UPI001319C901|nr:hypothetical protein [Pseudoalteromonas sp. T1lg48]
MKSVAISKSTSATIDSWDNYIGLAVRVSSGIDVWFYKPTYINHKFGEGYYFSHWLFKLQIEPTGKVFVINPKLDFPQSQHVKQPEGYPLQPTSKDV